MRASSSPGMTCMILAEAAEAATRRERTNFVLNCMMPSERRRCGRKGRAVRLMWERSSHCCRCPPCALQLHTTLLARRSELKHDDWRRFDGIERHYARMSLLYPRFTKIHCGSVAWRRRWGRARPWREVVEVIGVHSVPCLCQGAGIPRRTSPAMRRAQRPPRAALARAAARTVPSLCWPKRRAARTEAHTPYGAWSVGAALDGIQRTWPS